MKSDRQSRTAGGVAFARALEQFRPDGVRLLDDPFAVALAREGVGRLALGGPRMASLFTGVLSTFMPGMIEFVSIRARYADEVVLAEARDRGAEQWVVLGAGFDTGPLRLGPSLPGVAIFEVDHPATQAAKRDALARCGLGTAEGTRLVAVDFERDDLVERLLASGFDRERRSVVTWMGVTYYLTEAAIASTLDKLAGLLAAGSALTLDYVGPEVIAGTARHRAARVGVRRARQAGEPFLFGVDPDGAAALLAAHGFEVSDRVSPADMEARYAAPGRRVIDFAHFVTARRG